MTRTVVASFAVLLLVSAPVAAKKTEPRRRAWSRIAAETLQPGSPFDCDTPRGSAWFGSTARCLAELCRGRNVTNAAVVGGDGRLRANPCVQRIDDRR
ncbi:MAG: hypothetical protein IT294_01740 [Deltaproteobacteria bacterium]|nr:hypothetical protein [Deltaproteobacteria bacterium]